MREMKDSGFSWLNDIPSDWTMKRVKYLFTRKNEKAQKENPIILSLARVGVRERDISNNEGQLAESYFNYNPVDIDDLLLNPMDLYSGANCSISKIKGVISPAYINLRAKTDVNPTFYDYYFKVQYWLMAFFSYGKGVSFDNRWTLNTETLMNYPIVSLPYDEQCRRADYLDNKCSKIDAIIEREQAVIEKLKEYRLSFITEQVMKSEFTEVSLGKLINLIEQGWSPTQTENKNDIWYVLSLAAVKAGKFHNNEVKPISGGNEKTDRLRLKDGDFLLTRSNTRELVGTVCIVENVLENTIFSDLIYRIVFKEKFVNLQYVLYCFQSSIMRQQIERDAHGSSSTMVKITHKDINNWKFPLISMQEQISVCDRIEKMDSRLLSQIDERKKVIDKLTEYKKSLIYEVVTGKKEV